MISVTMTFDDLATVSFNVTNARLTIIGDGECKVELASITQSSARIEQILKDATVAMNIQATIGTETYSFASTGKPAITHDVAGVSLILSGKFITQ